MAKNRLPHRSVLALALLVAGGGLLLVSTHSPALFDVAQAQSSGVTVTIPQGAAGMGPQAYGQNPLQIGVGTTVTWMNGDTTAHTVTSDTPGQFDSGPMQPGDNFRHTFDTVGTYPYHCAIHGAQSMSGVVQVVGGAVPGPIVSPSPSPSPSLSPSPSPSPSLSPLPSPTKTPTGSPSGSPTPIAGFVCDAQGLCCGANGCVPSNNFTCDTSGECCLYLEGSSPTCSQQGYQCANGYCCSAEGHCGSTQYGSGLAHCDIPNHYCCDEHGNCKGGYDNCDLFGCADANGNFISTMTPPHDPRPSPSPSASPSTSPSMHPSGTPSGAPTGGATTGPTSAPSP